MKESQLWFLQLITGALLLVLAFSHISTFSSLIGTGYKTGLEYSSLIERAKPLFYVIFYSVFLTVLMYHANYGLRTLLIEFTGGKYKTLITMGVFIVAFITYLYGLWEIIIFHLIAGGG
jgi:succinate dehydrogenase/fumarate reductase cytochrome b subunit